MNHRSTIQGIIFAIMIGLSLWLLQQLLMPKYMDNSRDGRLIAEYYDSDFNHDVVFVGDCEVYENISPVTLWENYGISSYIRGSAQQTIWQSYYLIEDTFRYESPKVIVFNVLSMKYNSPDETGSAMHREAYNRMTLDGMRWSHSKWKAIMSSMTKEELEWNSQWSYLFPILRFHERWSQLNENDFLYLFHSENISYNGFLMHNEIRPFVSEHVEPKPIDFRFGSNSYAYLEKMVDLCRAHGTELVLIKAPSLSPTWWNEWDSQIREFAEEYDLTYINCLEHQNEIGLDWSRDTYDTGLHLNVYGAEKLSMFLGSRLKTICELPDHREDKLFSSNWSEICESYKNEKLEIKR